MISWKLEYSFPKLQKADTHGLCNTKNVPLASTSRLSRITIEHRATSSEKHIVFPEMLTQLKHSQGKPVEMPQTRGHFHIFQDVNIKKLHIPFMHRHALCSKL